MPLVRPGRGSLGLWGLFVMLFGTIVGVGWVVASSTWILKSGPLGAALAFGAGALIMILIDLCYAEMMTVHPDSAGTIGYVYESFGLTAAYVVGWLLLGSYVAVCGFFVVTIPWLVKALSPALLGPSLYSVQESPVQLGGLLIGAGIALSIGLVNHFGSKAVSRYQSVVVVAKILLAFALAAAAIYAGKSELWTPLFAGNSRAEYLNGFIVVFITTPFWFSGFDYLPQMFRERKENFPLHKVGSLMLLTVLAALAFYSMIIFATASLVERQALTAMNLPVYDAFRVALQSPLMGYVVLGVAFSGVLSAWNATIFATSRVMHALSSARLIPKGLDQIHSKYGTPVLSIWLVTISGILLGLLGPNAVNALVTASGVTIVGAFVFVCAALIKDRARHPQRIRPYRVPGGIGVIYLALFASCGLLILALLDPFMAQKKLPVEWTLIICWLILGAIWWFASKAQRDGIVEKERRNILMGAE